MRLTEFFVILHYFLPFYFPLPLTTRKTKILKKWKKHLEIRDKIILHMHTKRIIWCMVPEIWCTTDGTFCHFGALFAFLPNKPQNQNFEKMKKNPGNIINLHKCTKNHDLMLNCSWDMACNGCNFYFPFWTSFCPFTP